MIDSLKAFEITQTANLKNWLNLATDKLSKQILKAASIGAPGVEINFQDLLIGAEDLYEAGEIFINLQTILSNNGHKNIITPEGNLYITWKNF